MTEAERISVARILRVNHAGEFGAIRIYGAQVAFSRALWPSLVSPLTELRSHEIRHCTVFRDAMPSRNARPCRAMWLWGCGGWALGAMTALLGPKAIWACTEAVEDVVHDHLDAQIAFLRPLGSELANTIAEIQTEEEGHLALAKSNKGADSSLTSLLDRIIRPTVHGLVWLSTNGDSARMRRDLEAAA